MKKTIFIEKISISNEEHNACFITTKLTNQEHFPLMSKLTITLIKTYLNL
jgi:hypothetical protein